MCDPVTLGAAAVAAGTGAYQTRRAGRDEQRAAQARSQEAAQELTRQRALQSEAQQSLTNALNAAAPASAATDLNQSAQPRLAAVNNVALPPSAFSVSAQGAPAIMRDQINSQISAGGQDSRERAQALANVFSYGDANLNRNIAAQRSGQQLGDLANFAGVSNSVNRSEQQSADFNARKGPSMFADALGGAAQLAMLLGGGGSGKPSPTQATKGPLNLMTGKRM